MPRIESRIDIGSAAYAENRAHMLGLIEQLRGIEAATRAKSAQARALFERRGQLLPRERVARVLDAGAPWLELSSLAGYAPDRIAGGGVIAGIGMVADTRVMLVADDAGIDAGALQAMGLQKFVRAQEIARRMKLPFVHLVESAGANLLQYKVEMFVHGGRAFCNLARHSAAGLPVIVVVHGSSTAGGAYMTGLADYVVTCGPRQGVPRRTARELIGALGRQVPGSRAPDGPAPRFDAEPLLGVFAPDAKKPIDMREVIARIVDDSDWLEFKADHGPATVCGHASIAGHRIGIVTNNGPLDPPGSTKVTHFVQAFQQSALPIVWLQNTTGFIVGVDAERAGMIKHGSKQIQALANATVPQLTVHAAPRTVPATTACADAASIRTSCSAGRTRAPR